MRPIILLSHLLAFAILPLSARADPVIDRVLDTVVLPAVTEFATRSAALAQVADRNCLAENPDLQAAWNAAMDSWLVVQDFRFGPLEDGTRRQAIAFWPDSSGHRPRALSRLLSGADPILKTPAQYGAEAVSVRGLYALEAMLYDPDFSHYGANDPGCMLVKAATADLAAGAKALSQDWHGDFATTMQTAGQSGNERFLDPSEVRQVVFTALLTSLQFDVLERLGLPLGTYDKPRPLRAEGRFSGRSQRNLELSLAAHDALALALVPEVDQTVGTREDFERIRWMASKLADADFSGVDDPGQRFKLEALQTALGLLRTTANQEMSKVLGVTMGLNALDGD